MYLTPLTSVFISVFTGDTSNRISDFDPVGSFNFPIQLASHWAVVEKLVKLLLRGQRFKLWHRLITAAGQGLGVDAPQPHNFTSVVDP